MLYSLRDKYVKYKNTLTTLLRTERRTFYCSKLEHNKSNLKQTWNIINNVLNKKKDHNTINQIKLNDTTIVDKSMIARSFNNYFSNIGPNLAKKIPNSNKSFRHFLRNENPNTLLSFIPTDAQEIKEIVNDLKGKRVLVMTILAMIF